MQNIIEKIKKQIEANQLIIYIKGTPSNPMCGFSAKVVNILNLLELEYSYVNVLENNEIRRALPVYSHWPTFPQVYYKTKLIGGADIISDLYDKNELKKILTS
ncbi:MAG TPA: Grx4 family monothiol glutaredoxin [Candidatus Azoamicus sp. OHIO2]